jgi:integrase
VASIETRKSAKGTTTYRVKIRLDGKPPATRTFTRFAPARAWATATESAMRDGTYATGSGRACAAAVDAFLASELSGKKDQRMLRTRVAWWREELGSLKLRDLTADHIAVGLDRLAATRVAPRKPDSAAAPRSAATINRYRAAISAVLTWCERKSPPWINSNPARKTSHRPETAGRTRFLSADERAALLAEARQSASRDLYLAVVLSLATGGRQGEVMSLRWPDVDLQRGSVAFRDTKNGDPRAVPLPAGVVGLLRDRCRVVRLDTDLVFPSVKDPQKPIDLRVSFRVALRRAGISDFRWHDLRHSAASALADLGASLLDIGTILGHRSEQTTKRYAHLTDSRLRHLIEQAAQRHRVA